MSSADAARDPCKKYNFKKRMRLATRLLNGYDASPGRLRHWSQMNYVQKVNNPGDAVGTADEFKAPAPVHPKEAGNVAVSFARKAIATKTPGGKKFKHSEAFAINHVDLIEEKKDNQRTLIIVSTYSPCAKCGAAAQIQKLCNGVTWPAMPKVPGAETINGAKRYKKCIYLYGKIWSAAEGAGKTSPPTPAGWDVALMKAGIDVVHQCDLPVMRSLDDSDTHLAQSAYINYIPNNGYDKKQQQPGIGYNFDEYYDDSHSMQSMLKYPGYYNNNLDSTLIATILALFAMCLIVIVSTICGAVCGGFTAYVVSKNNKNKTPTKQEYHQVDQV